MSTDINREYKRFNELYKELDESYERFADICGLSTCAMWVIYALRSGGDGNATQTDIVKRYFLKKQSVCSAIRKLEQDGYITLSSMPDNGKNKILNLTDKGMQLAKEKIDRLLSAEQATFESLTQKEQSQFTKLYEKYIAALKNNINAIK